MLLFTVAVHLFIGLHGHGVEKLTDSKEILIPASIFIASSIALFLLGIVGCAGALKEQRCLLGFVSFRMQNFTFPGYISASLSLSVLDCSWNNFLGTVGECSADLPIQGKAELELRGQHE